MPPSPEQDRRWEHLKSKEEAITATWGVIFDMTQFTIGPGELEELGHVPIETRRAEMVIFYYWWTVQLLFNATDYEFKTDYAEFLANNLAAQVPGVTERLQARYLEYDGAADTGIPLSEQGRRAFRRALAHIAPDRSLPEPMVDEWAEAATRNGAQYFRDHTPW